MKRDILAVVVPVLLAASAANAAEIYNKDGKKLDLYGKVDGLHYFSDAKYSESDQSYANFGFKGETQISDKLTGYGQWEYKIKVNSNQGDGASKKATCVSFAGLKFGDVGSLDYGRNHGILHDVEAWTDILPEFGGNTYTVTDNYMTGPTDSVATYRNKNFFGLVDGLNFAVQYQGENDDHNVFNEITNKWENSNPSKNSRTLQNQNGKGWGLSTTYNFGTGISAGAAYASSERTKEQTTRGMTINSSIAGGKRADAWTAGVKYNANNVYLATTYAETHNMTPYHDSIADKTQNLEVVAQYQFDFGLRPSVSYLQSKGKDPKTNHSTPGYKHLVKYIDVGATYDFKKNMSTYLDYKINLLNNNNFTKDNSISTDDIIAVGLVYRF
ncbi:porin OmpC [Candidatus Profftia sp. (ex Adelges kitamiensis)]|uniref:porin OmpC n=1 Tax=Candidatus Profftia sp. (ex Adelges kitamiensis) TaxID=2864218 RepID=UPI001CE34CB7|nr:porin OmpC [Candidatus Profftia sp. (ex Adelges kitamiensis)]